MLRPDPFSTPYTSLAGFYKRKGDFSIGKDVHRYVDEGFSLVDVFNDGFLGIVQEGKVDFGFCQGEKRKLGNKNYSK